MHKVMDQCQFEKHIRRNAQKIRLCTKTWDIKKKIRVLIVLCILKKKWPQKGRQMFETTYYRTVFCINDEKYLGKDGLYVIKDNVLQKESSLSWKEERCIQAPSLKSSPPLWWSFFQVSFAQKMDDLSSTKIPASSHAPLAQKLALECW